MYGEELIIESVQAREILDSRGNPTVEVDVILAGGIAGRPAIPSGASTGAHEAVALRSSKKTQYLREYADRTIKHDFEVIVSETEGMSVSGRPENNQPSILLDGTENKSRLGANAILGVTLACAKAAVEIHGTPLYRYTGGCNASRGCPVPTMNILNGGSHADNNVDIQDIVIMPFGAARFCEPLPNIVDIYTPLKTLFEEKGLYFAVGDEKSFAPIFRSTEADLQAMMAAIERAGCRPGEDIMIAFRVAPGEFGTILPGGYPDQIWNRMITTTIRPFPVSRRTRNRKAFFFCHFENPEIRCIPQKPCVNNVSAPIDHLRGNLPSVTTPKPMLLIVEDDPVASDMIADDLQVDFEILRAFEVDEALRIIKSNEIKIMVLDLFMGDRSGFEILETVKNSTELKEIIVVVYTASQRAGDEDRCLSLGAAAYIQKSETIANLLQTLKFVLSFDEIIRGYRQEIHNWRDAYSILAHDVKGPLGILLHYLNRIQPHLDGKPKKAVDSVFITMRLIEMNINTTIKLFNLDKNQTSIGGSKVDLIQVAKEAMEILDVKIKKKGIGVSIHAPKNSIDIILADQGFFETAIYNIAKNAVEACPESGDITFDFIEGEEQIILKVTNSGSVSPAMRNCFFERFRSDKPSGTGLGTFQAKLAINKLGGKISMNSSTSENKTTITIILPKA